MREGTVTRRMASVFNELGSEFENQYSAMDFREVLDALWEAKSQRMEVLALLYTMLDACGVKYQKRQNNQYYEDLVKTIRFPSYFEIEDRMLRAMYDRYIHYLSPSDYMKRVVDKLSDPADGWEDASLRLRILKQFIKYGIYSFTTVNHRGKYAALNVSNASVVRFNSQNSYYSSTSSAINVHRRDSNSIAAASASWVNSAGCLLVGASGTGSSSEYAKFIKALGIVSGSASATSTYSTYITGKIVIDRTYAYSYLSAVGYTDGAIKAIG